MNGWIAKRPGLWMGVALSFLGACLYGSTLSFPFVFDDLVYFVENPLARDWRSFLYPWNFGEFARRSMVIGLSNDLSLNFITRPVCYLTFYINHFIGGLDPRGFRGFNIVVHCANALLVWHLIRLWTLRSPKAGSLDGFSVALIPISVSALFLVHPLQTESVTYVIQRFTSLGTLFFLGAVLAHVRALNGSVSLRLLSVVLLMLGMLTKEFVFMAPLVMVLVDWIMMGRPLHRAIRRAWPALACLPVIPALLLLTTLAQNPQAHPWDALHVANGAVDGGAQWSYALTQPGVIWTYIKLLILPSGFNVDPDVAAATSLAEPRVYLAILGLGGLLLASFWLYLRGTESFHGSGVLLGTCWFFLTLALDSSLVPLPDFMAEHRSYLPSVGALLAMVCLGDLLRCRYGEGRTARLAVAGAMVVVVGTLGVLTWQRNQLWRSATVLWTDAAEKSPRKGRVFVNLGNAYLGEGKAELAMDQYRWAIEVDPTNTAAYNNLSAVLIRSGEHHEAVEVAIKGLYAPSSIYHHLLYFNIGVCHMEWKDRETARACLQAALRLAPRHLPSHLELGKLFYLEGDHENSLHHWKIALELAPSDQRLSMVVAELEREAARVAFRR